MAFPQTQIATAERLIKKFGQLAIWIVPGSSTPVAPAQPWGEAIEVFPATHDVWICVLPESRIGYEWVKYLVGTEIPDGNGYFLMAGSVPFIPALTDSVLLADDTTLKPNKIDCIAPSGVPILYTGHY